MKFKIISLFFISCISGYLNAQTSKYVNLLNDTTIHLRIDGWKSDIFENPNPPKSYTYEYDYGLPYVENLRNGFMDTFSIENTRFRYRLGSDTSENCIVEKFENEKWRSNFGTNYSSYQDSFLCDVNNDGYADFIEDRKWYSSVILFNPFTKEFDTSTHFLLNEWFTLDKVKNIFCNSVNVHGGQDSSSLYTFNGVQRKVLYFLEFIKNDDDYTIIKEIKLYKVDIENNCKNCILINTKKIHNKNYEFDYISYWKKRYKKLLSCR